MNTALWIVQEILAAMFLMAGYESNNTKRKISA
ncbi:hypothetical protein BH10BAC2_BH10BAC2_43570 [soil metagenome]